MPLHKTLDDVKAMELLNPPERKNPTTRLPNVKKYYKYPRNWLYNTNECVMLKNEIKGLIHKGHLNEYKKSK